MTDPTNNPTDLIERAKQAEGRELDALAAEHVMGWTDDPELPDTFWMDPKSKCSHCKYDDDDGYAWSPTSFLDDAAQLEAEIERRGLWWEYVNALGHMLEPEMPKHCLWLTSELYWKMLRATATQRTRAAVITCLQAKGEQS